MKAILSIATLAMLAGVAGAQQRPVPHEPKAGECHPYPEVAAVLMFGFGEVTTGRTLVEQTGSAVEVFIGPKGSMTVVEVFSDNTTCYRAFNPPSSPWHQLPPGRRSA